MTVKRRRTTIEPIEPDRYYSAKQLAERYQIHVITVYKWWRRGVLPRPTRMGPNTTRVSGKAILEHEAALGS